MNIYNKKLFFLMFISIISVGLIFLSFNIYDLQQFKEDYFKALKKELIHLKKEHLKERINRLNNEFIALHHEKTKKEHAYLEKTLNLIVNSLNIIKEKYNIDIIKLLTQLNIKNIILVKNNKIIFNPSKISLNNKKYIFDEKNLTPNIKLIIFSPKTGCENELINYINKFDINNDEYIFIYKIINLDKAKVLAIRESAVRKIGQIVDLNKPENLIWKKMLIHMIQTKHYSLFKEYKFINPSNNRVEKKIAYFLYNPELHILLGQGIYLSDIYDFIENIQKDYEAKLYQFILKSVLAFFLLIGLLFFIIYKYINHLISELYRLNNEFKQEILKQETELIYGYTHDNLTKLPNRNALLDDQDKIKTLIAIDINMFGVINDIYGIEIGNFILKEFAKNLQVYFSEYETKHKIYRIGSDEFAIAFFEEIDLTKEDIKKLIKFCRNAPIKVSNLEINIDVTLGIASNEEEILTKADLALNYAKKHNREYIIFNEDFEVKVKLENYLHTIQLIKKAIEEDRVVPFYQCIKDKEGNTIKFEALIRIIDEKGNVLSPYYFLEVAKKARLYFYLTKIVIEKSLKEFENSPYTISINLSYEDITNEEIRNFVIEKIKHYKNKDKIVIELLEDESIENFEIVRCFIKELKQYGVKFAIDDFGSGYSNFIYLLELDVDYIKIDSSLIKKIIKDKNAVSVVKLIVKFAKEQNLKTVAEFVATKEIFEKAKALGIDEFQGFYFCEPTPEIK